MTIKAYVGRMGSGKTYEVVTEVILNALRRGRRVVSNIAGLNFEAMREIIVAEGIAPEHVGELVTVDHAKIVEPTFWRTDKDASLGVEAFVQPGDLLAMDEIWRFWSGFARKGDDGAKRPDRVMNFFRMHRHFTHPQTGVACDVAIVTQDVMDINRQVRAVIEETYRMEKLTAIGSASRYRVDIFQGVRLTRRPLRQLQRSYNPELFHLYSSHSQKKAGDADAREENIDDRGNILKGALFKIGLPLGACVLLLCVWWLYRFFHPEAPIASTQAEAKADAKGRQSARSPDSNVSDEWRVAGHFDFGNGVNFYLQDGEGSRILVNPPNFKLTAYTAEVLLPSGEAVTSWSGGKSKAGLIETAGSQ